MENILITMTDDGNLSCEDANGGYIEELRARQLVFTVNSLFQSDIISYFTISFEPKGFGKKIVSDNIYKQEPTSDTYYSDGKIYCPVYDYVSVSPKVKVQIDGYETDENDDISAIYKSGIMELTFSESIVGEKFFPDTENADLKLSEKIKEKIGEELVTFVAETSNVADSAITNKKIADLAVRTNHINYYAVTTDRLSTGAVTTPKISDGAVTTAKIADNSITTDKITNRSVTTKKIAAETITNNELASGSVTASKIAAGVVLTEKIADANVTTAKIKDLAVTTSKIANSSVSPEKLQEKYALQSDFVSLETDVATNAENIKTLSSSVSENSQDIQTLRDSFQSYLTTIETQLVNQVGGIVGS